MEAMDESRIWQRVRGTDPAERTRNWLTQQAALLERYRILSRRGGKFRELHGRKERQCACLRGLLRLQTGQGAALPKNGTPPRELADCFDPERQFLQELTDLTRDPGLGAVYDALRETQQVQCRLLLEMIGSM